MTSPSTSIEGSIYRNSSKDYTMIVKKLRLQHGWSQDHLAQISGLSIRTIQRIEQGQKAGLESLKSLAAVFDIHITELQKEPEMDNTLQVPDEKTARINKEKAIKKFYSRLTIYVAVITLLLIINLYTNPAYLWVVWPALGWGIGMTIRALKVFEVFTFSDAQ